MKGKITIATPTRLQAGDAEDAGLFVDQQAAQVKTTERAA